MTVQRAILTALDRVHPYLLPETTLYADVNGILGEPITLSGFRTELAKCEVFRRVVSVRDEDTRSYKWGITDNGRAKLLE